MINLIFLTGDKQTGKTITLQNWVVSQQYIAGILTPIVNGKRCFYNIATQQFTNMEVDENVVPADAILTVGKYLFIKQNFINASQVLISAAADTTLDYLVIDEVGPLELKQQKGFYQALLFVLENITTPTTLIIVVRPNCIDDLQALANSFGKQSVVYHIDDFKDKVINISI